MAKSHVEYTRMTPERRKHLAERSYKRNLDHLESILADMLDNGAVYKVSDQTAVIAAQAEYSEKLEALLAAGAAVAASERIPELERVVERLEADVRKWRQRAEDAEAAVASMS